jgi:tRNA(fMet)-specific endonuclease VapC
MLDLWAGSCNPFEEKGAPIGAMDLLIASHALWLDAIIVTDNIREFQRVPDLKIENWGK